MPLLASGQPNTARRLPEPRGSGALVALALWTSGLAHPGNLLASADLAVTAVDTSGVVGDWQTLSIGGRVAADIRNRGTDTVFTPFRIVFFEDLDWSGDYDPGFDNLLGTTSLSTLSGGATRTVRASVVGQVVFRENPILVFVDSDAVVVESDETNNVAGSADDCFFYPPVGSFDPVGEWAWASSPVLSDWLNVMTTPAVVDVNADGVPDVIFPATASRGGGPVELGVIRVLSGDDGRELFTIDDPAYYVNATSSVAVGDIDGDLLPEIIACDQTGGALIAFEHDGRFKWRSAPLEFVAWGAPAIADLDGDGMTEIVIGRQALDRTGALLWTGTGGRGTQGAGPLSTVADIDLDGSPDVVAGNTAYSATGAIKWQAPLGDGYVGIGNFDADDFAEVVLVTGGAVYLLEHDGTVIWGPSVVPGGGAVGAPVVADLDADGQVEIGVAGATRYVVFETDGSLAWQAVTRDASSNVTGSSAFDFEGDGSAEIVYRDETNLWIYRGTDGAVLFVRPMSSCTWHEYPVIADVDADGNAEIVVTANDNCGVGPDRGVIVIGDSTDLWVRTRMLWNQHTYHITNINDNQTTPRRELDNWRFPIGSPFNNFRQNLLTRDLPPVAAPDLTASRLVCLADPAPRIVARIGNGGAASVGPGIPIAFYDDDPRTVGTLVGLAATTVPLAPGRFEDVGWLLPPPPGFDLTGTVFVVADDSGGLSGSENECNEGNNLHWRTDFVPAAAAGADASLCEGRFLLLDAGGSRDPSCPRGLEYEWRAGALVVRPWNADPRWRPPTFLAGTTTYTVAVRCVDPGPGCEATDDLVVEVRYCPLAVSFDHLSVRWVLRPDRPAIWIEWVTSSEDGTMLFVIDRADAPTGPWREVGIVRPLGPGRRYLVRDTDVLTSRRYWYRIIEYDLDGMGDASPTLDSGPPPLVRDTGR